MDAERPKFEAGAKENGVDAKRRERSLTCLKFANYGFVNRGGLCRGQLPNRLAEGEYPVEFMVV